MMAIKLLRYSVAIILLLLAAGLLIATIVSSQLDVAVRIALGAGALISGLLGIGCIINPGLAKRVLIGRGIDKT